MISVAGNHHHCCCNRNGVSVKLRNKATGIINIKCSIGKIGRRCCDQCAVVRHARKVTGAAIINRIDSHRDACARQYRYVGIGSITWAGDEKCENIIILRTNKLIVFFRCKNVAESNSIVE